MGRPWPHSAAAILYTDDSMLTFVAARHVRNTFADEGISLQKKGGEKTFRKEPTQQQLNFQKFPHVAVARSTGTEYQITLSQPKSSSLPKFKFFCIAQPPSAKPLLFFGKTFVTSFNWHRDLTFIPLFQVFPHSTCHHLIN